MGEEKVSLARSDEDTQQFVKYVLRDLRALEKMIEQDWFEKDVVRIGAEQELCLVDEHAKPLPKALEVLNLLGKGNYTTELAKFNLEVNMAPLEFKEDCFSRLDLSLHEEIEKVRTAANSLSGDVILTGILPTIRKADVDMENLTPLPRYKALCEAINKFRGKEFDLRIQGTDELLIRMESPLIEACNTGFQVHLQVSPEDFARKYNISQAITGPVLSCAAVSPLLFGKRLWAETRVALFHQSVDTRTVDSHLRDSTPRVTFGNGWLKKSILEIYKEDIARYKVMLNADVHEDVEQMMEKGIAPELMALKVHNSTIYRWNRPCYGVGGGKPHLRIENRIFGAGPTVIDEVANAAFWLGLLNGMEEVCADITQKLDFDDAKMNFFAAAKLGLDTKFTWLDGKRIAAVNLIKKILLPIAKEGLLKAGVYKNDVEIYLDVIKERVKKAETGAFWMVKSYNELLKNHSRDQALTAITKATIQNQKKGEPSYKWPLARFEDIEDWKPSSLLVEEFMTTDLFTVGQSDIMEFVCNLMDWQRIRYAPVEDDQKHLIGLVTMRMLLREYVKAGHEDKPENRCVKDIMIKNPVTIHPEASIMDALGIMAEKQIGCLPVVKNGRLIGIVTEHNFMNITQKLIKTLKNK